MARRGAKSTKLKRRRNALAPQNRAKSNTVASAEQTENARLSRELREAQEREAATAEVLQLISKSPGDLDALFRAMLENATRLCEAKFGTLFRYDGEKVHRLAGVGTPASLTEFQRKRGPFVPPAGTHMFESVRTKRPLTSDDEAAVSKPGVAATYGGARSTLYVPLLKDDRVVGIFVIYRQEVRPFADKQIGLVQSFAAQAVIAIENARLLNELRQRTNDLSEALEQQTATSEVLTVISSSPGELQPVFEAMLENATRLCGAKFGNLLLYDGTAFQVSAMHGAPPAWEALRRRNPEVRGGRAHPLSRIAATRQMQHIADIRTEEAYLERDPAFVPLVDAAGARTLIMVPMLKENELVGAFGIYRQEVRPFTDKQIELVQNFAAQAVIAIENTRLLNELRASLERQTATSEVLQVISRSPGDLEPVFECILANAVGICGAKFGNLHLYQDRKFVTVAQHGAPRAYAELRQREPVVHLTTGSSLDRIARTKQIVHIDDLAADPAHHGHAIVTLGAARTLLAVPMLKDDDLIGAIGIYNQEVRPFNNKQIELVQNFAAQAVIAIENTRLLSELREALEQQTATSEVLKVISSSPGELEPVFNAMLENATRICDAKFGFLWLSEGDGFRAVALHRVPLALVGERQREPVIYPGPQAPLGRVGRTEETAPRSRHHGRARLPRRESCARRVGRCRWCAHPFVGPDAQGKRTRRRDLYLPPRGSPIHRQTD